MNIVVLASGSGSNFEVLAKAFKIKLLITDKKNAFVRQRAKRLKVRDVFLDPKKSNFNKALFGLLKKEKAGLVLLAGYMRILSPYLVKKFKNRIINIHPALLPAFKGTNSIKRALDYGVKVTGVTVHFVDDKVDHGPIILQEEIKITPKMTLAQLTKKTHQLEHKLYPQAVKLFLNKRLKVRGRVVGGVRP